MAMRAEDSRDQVITDDDSKRQPPAITPPLGDVEAVLAAKNEVIETLRGETESQRKVIESLTEQNATLVNMTHRLTAGPQEEKEVA